MSLQTIVQNAPLDDDAKQKLLAQIAAEGDTPEVREIVKDALQEYIDAGFKELGVELDPNDPNVQAVTAQANEELDAIEAEYAEELENLSIDAAVVQSKTNKALDAVEANTLKAGLAA